MRFKRRFMPPENETAQLKQALRDEMESILRGYVVGQEVERLRANVKIEVLAPEYLLNTALN